MVPISKTILGQGSPRHSGIISDEKCYLYRSTRPFWYRNIGFYGQEGAPYFSLPPGLSYHTRSSYHIRASDSARH